MADTGRHGNTVNRHKPGRLTPTVRKVPVDTVAHGRNITHKEYLWAAYDGETLLAVAATAEEARVKGRDVMRRQGRAA